MSQIKAQIEETTSDYDKEKLQERLAKLSGGVAVIKVGAATEVELKEKKHRIEDALSTTRAAVEEGLVAGGGTTLLQAIPALDKIKLEGDAQVGVDIVRKALEAPARQIADNAGAHGEVVVEHVKTLKIGHGYDALNGEYGDMFKKGIVDAAKVTRSALQNAASIAAMVLTTETLITDLPEKEKAGAGGGHDHGGGGDGLLVQSSRTRETIEGPGTAGAFVIPGRQAGGLRQSLRPVWVPGPAVRVASGGFSWRSALVHIGSPVSRWRRRAASRRLRRGSSARNGSALSQRVSRSRRPIARAW